MNTRDQLREVVAKMLMVPPDEVGPETSLATLGTSLAGARLALGLKRVGLSLPGHRVPARFAELSALVMGEAPTPPAASPAFREPMPVPELQAGLDIQEIGELPVASDYWDHEFYRGIFDKTEIAYAVVQSEPRIHLAGFWCAKEALRKCDPSFAGVSLLSLTVAHEESGKPYLVSVTESRRLRLPHAVSITHTGPIAGAVVALSPQAATAATPSPAPVPVPARSSGSAALIALVLAAASLLCGLTALLRTFR